ncbi:MAG TPA: transglycosylase SLT domain-containing protein [Gemmatimonadaceae bacterium]|nr:transglycosylase SLT domain-containing protein [Gemmatimonadaceae bacterium]
MITATARGAIVVLGALALAACHSSRPAVAPTPATASASDTATRTVASDSTGDTSKVAAPAVTGEALQIFGDTSAQQVPAMTPDSAVAAADSAPEWDIDVHSFETRTRVAYFVDRFQNGAHQRFGDMLARGGRYEKMIRAKLKAAGLPQDMTYLALIESGYDPHAYSSAAAVGLWQLMASTARGTGLRVDWWVDERRDPVRSTDAAIKFLGWLNEQFGSLYLAAAAYDGGPGRVARGLSRYADELEGQSGDEAFFALAQKDYLRAETRDYVPKLIAAALIAKDPKRYGFDITYDSEYDYDSVRVGPATPLAAVAKAAHTTTASILDLNPDILRGMTPPRDSFTVRIPLGTVGVFDSSYAVLPASERTAYKRAESRRGDTMVRLAQRAGVSVKQLEWYNPKLKSNRHGRVATGETVLFPAATVVAAARDVPDPSIERYGSSGRSMTHVVRKGESLGLIAKHYHTTVKSLMRLNGLRKSIIFPGEVLLVKGSSRRTSHKSTVRAAHSTTSREKVAQSGNRSQ